MALMALGFLGAWLCPISKALRARIDNIDIHFFVHTSGSLLKGQVHNDLKCDYTETWDQFMGVLGQLGSKLV